MLTNSLFLDFLKENGLDVYKGVSTRDVICLEFKYGSRTYQKERAHLEKLLHDADDEERKTRIQYLIDQADANIDKYIHKSADEIRTQFYTEGLTIRYPSYDDKQYTYIKYKMLYRTPGKAKKGSCMFIREELYEKAHDFLWMGLNLPQENAPIVEIGAYSSLITSTVVDRVCIEPENILILNDVCVPFETNIVSVEIDEAKHCQAIPYEHYSLKNEMFDGQALIDAGVFPADANGYILLRHHFTKMAAFKTNIQKYFMDYFGDDYETATVTDMFGNEHLAKDIKLITTNNAVKWLKFDVSYEYWCEWVRKNGCMFGIVKTAHESKLGDVQRMSYQMVNALSSDIMGSVLSLSKEYIDQLKNSDEVFDDYLKRNTNYFNDFDVLLALTNHNPDFRYCEYYRSRKNEIIRTYVNNLKLGRTIQNADNLVIVGSPYAMLLHSVGEDATADPTFSQESGCIQCWTARFEDDERLAEFRSPFNSRNNLGYLHNVHHEYFDKYFDFGSLIVAVNMNGTDFQDRNNGSDQDSDSLYVTNQKDIVAHAKFCYDNYPTIVNNIPKDTNHYNNTLEDFAKIDNTLAAAQLDIGESSNLAQICLSYTYNFPDQKYQDYVCILSVLAQAAIDKAKRVFDVSIGDEIKRIKKDINIKENKYPAFWTQIARKNGSRLSTDKINYSLKCPMNDIFFMKLPKVANTNEVLPMSDFFVKHELTGSRKLCHKIQKFVEDFSIDLYNTRQKKDVSVDDWYLLMGGFDELVAEIRLLSLSPKYLPLMSWLIDRAFMITPALQKNKETIDTRLNKNRPLLMKALYVANPECFLKCFKGTPKPM